MLVPFTTLGIVLVYPLCRDSEIVFSVGSISVWEVKLKRSTEDDRSAALDTSSYSLCKWKEFCVHKFHVITFHEIL